MYALPSARNENQNKLDQYVRNGQRNQPLQPISRYGRHRNNISHDVKHDHSYLPGQPRSRSSKRNMIIAQKYQNNNSVNPEPANFNY